MKKVFCFIGSSKNEKSATYQFSKMIIDSLREKDKEISYDIFPADSVKLNFCKGCLTCLTQGFCPQDKTDDMGLMKEKMMSSDLIIFGSPNYVMNISGQMKTFLDRMQSWYFRFQLAGKVGVAVMTSGGQITAITAPDDTQKYLATFMRAMGIKVLDTLFSITTPTGVGVDFIDREKTMSDAKNSSKNIYPYLSEDKHVESDPYLEFVFNEIKKMIINDPPLIKEKEYWEKEGMLSMNAFSEVLEKRRKVRK